MTPAICKAVLKERKAILRLLTKERAHYQDLAEKILVGEGNHEFERAVYVLEWTKDIIKARTKRERKRK